MRYLQPFAAALCLALLLTATPRYGQSASPRPNPLLFRKPNKPGAAPHVDHSHQPNPTNYRKEIL